ncbi:xylose isomerase [Paenibacillus thalictri]|uniref:Xylose isomerase n=2 Tax=Paenibacillus thalictri TaxID=2527873 RepID=A0A4Q9DP27_9BACL|nr:xylose isomerase [Paenibacillus thalictri]
MLNVMAGGEFPAAMDQFRAWGLKVVDLKNGIFGKSISDLSEEEADAAAQVLEERGLTAYCFSTELFYDYIEKGERHFREQHLAKLDGILRTAAKLRPVVIRLLSAKMMQRNGITNSTRHMAEQAPWVLDVYREAIDRIYEAGFHATIENEAHDCIWTNPQEIVTFFHELNRHGKVHYTYDVQNLWQMGTFPSLHVYEELKPHIGFLHLKGGQTEEGSNELKWRSALEDASWPVADIVQQAIADGVSPVICLNPSHGAKKEGYDYSRLTERDLRYLQSLIHGGDI